MERWPEFVKVEKSKEGQTGLSVPHLTGWEAVVFELQDVLEEAVDVILRRVDAEGSRVP